MRKGLTQSKCSAGGWSVYRDFKTVKSKARPLNIKLKKARLRLKHLKKYLRIKEKALAEIAVLLVLRKSSMGSGRTTARRADTSCSAQKNSRTNSAGEARRCPV